MAVMQDPYEENKDPQWGILGSTPTPKGAWPTTAPLIGDIYRNQTLEEQVQQKADLDIYQRKIDDLNFGDLVSHAISETWTLQPLFQEYHPLRWDREPGYVLPFEDYMALTEGVPVIAHEDILQAKSYDHAVAIRQNVLERIQHTSDITDAFGFAPVMASYIAGGLFDPVNLVTLNALKGVYAAASSAVKASRLARFAKVGTLAAAEGATMVGIRAVQDPLENEDHVLFAAALSGTLGGGLASIKGKVLNDAHVTGNLITQDAFQKVSPDSPWHFSLYKGDQPSLIWEPPKLGTSQEWGNLQGGRVSFLGNRNSQLTGFLFENGDGRQAFRVENDGSQRLHYICPEFKMSGYINERGKVIFDYETMISSNKDKSYANVQKLFGGAIDPKLVAREAEVMWKEFSAKMPEKYALWARQQDVTSDGIKNYHKTPVKDLDLDELAGRSGIAQQIYDASGNPTLPALAAHSAEAQAHRVLVNSSPEEIGSRGFHDAHIALSNQIKEAVYFSRGGSLMMENMTWDDWKQIRKEGIKDAHGNIIVGRNALGNMDAMSFAKFTGKQRKRAQRQLFKIKEAARKAEEQATVKHNEYVRDVHAPRVQRIIELREEVAKLEDAPKIPASELHYHGTTTELAKYIEEGGGVPGKGGDVWVSPSKQFASDFVMTHRMGGILGAKVDPKDVAVIPLRATPKNTFDFRRPDHVRRMLAEELRTVEERVGPSSVRDLVLKNERLRLQALIDSSDARVLAHGKENYAGYGRVAVYRDMMRRVGFDASYEIQSDAPGVVNLRLFDPLNQLEVPPRSGLDVKAQELQTEIDLANKYWVGRFVRNPDPASDTPIGYIQKVNDDLTFEVDYGATRGQEQSVRDVPPAMRKDRLIRMWEKLRRDAKAERHRVGEGNPYYPFRIDPKSLQHLPPELRVGGIPTRETPGGDIYRPVSYEEAQRTPQQINYPERIQVHNLDEITLIPDSVMNGEFMRKPVELKAAAFAPDTLGQVQKHLNHLESQYTMLVRKGHKTTREYKKMVDRMDPTLVDDSGSPIVLYHSTLYDYEGKPLPHRPGGHESAVWLGTDPEWTESWILGKLGTIKSQQDPAYKALNYTYDELLETGRQHGQAAAPRTSAFYIDSSSIYDSRNPAHNLRVVQVELERKAVRLRNSKKRLKAMKTGDPDGLDEIQDPSRRAHQKATSLAIAEREVDMAQGDYDRAYSEYRSHLKDPKGFEIGWSEAESRQTDIKEAGFDGYWEFGETQHKILVDETGDEFDGKLYRGPEIRGNMNIAVFDSSRLVPVADAALKYRSEASLLSLEEVKNFAFPLRRLSALSGLNPGGGKVLRPAWAKEQARHWAVQSNKMHRRLKKSAQEHIELHEHAERAKDGYYLGTWEFPARNPNDFPEINIETTGLQNNHWELLCKPFSVGGTTHKGNYHGNTRIGMNVYTMDLDEAVDEAYRDMAEIYYRPTFNVTNWKAFERVNDTRTKEEIANAAWKYGGGNGIATKIYMLALKEAQAEGAGFAHDFVQGTSSHARAIYARLQRAGVPFETRRTETYLEADAMSEWDSHWDALENHLERSPQPGDAAWVWTDNVEYFIPADKLKDLDIDAIAAKMQEAYLSKEFPDIPDIAPPKRATTKYTGEGPTGEAFTLEVVPTTYTKNGEPNYYGPRNFEFTHDKGQPIILDATTVPKAKEEIKEILGYKKVRMETEQIKNHFETQEQRQVIEQATMDVLEVLSARRWVAMRKLDQLAAELWDPVVFDPKMGARPGTAEDVIRYQPGQPRPGGKRWLEWMQTLQQLRELEGGLIGVPSDTVREPIEVFGREADDLFMVRDVSTQKAYTIDDLFEDTAELINEEVAATAKLRNVREGSFDDDAFADVPDILSQVKDDLDVFDDAGYQAKMSEHMANSPFRSLATAAGNFKESGALRWLSFRILGGFKDKRDEGAVKALLSGRAGQGTERTVDTEFIHGRRGLEDSRNDIVHAQLSLHSDLAPLHTEWRRLNKKGLMSYHTRQSQEEFGRLVGRITADRSGTMINEVPAHSREVIMKAVETSRTYWKDRLQWLKENAKGWEDVEFDEFYVPRFWDRASIGVHRYKDGLNFTDAELAKVFAEALMATHKNLHRVQALRMGTKFLERIGSNKFSRFGLINDVRMEKATAEDLAKILEDAFGFSPKEARELADGFRVTERKARHMMYRVKLDVDLPVEIVDRTGVAKEVRLSDFIDYNVFSSSRSYSRHTISKMLVDQIIEDFNLKNGPEGKYKNLDDIRVAILDSLRKRGVPINEAEELLDILIKIARDEPFSESTSFALNAQAARSTVFGIGHGHTFALSALAELNGAHFVHGLEGLIKSHLPALGKMMGGKTRVSRGEAKEWAKANGLGIREIHIARMDLLERIQAEGGSSAIGRQQAFRRFMMGLGPATMEISGLAKMTEWSDLAAYRTHAVHYGDQMLDGVRPPKARLDQMGLTVPEWDRIARQVRKQFKRQVAETGEETYNYNFSEWDDQGAIDLFNNAMIAEVKGVVQRTSRKDQPNFFFTGPGRHELAKIAFQYRGFGMSSISNYVVRNMRAGDARALSLATASIAGGAMAYVLGNMIAFQDTKEGRKKFEERMSLERVALGAFMRSGVNAGLGDFGNLFLGPFIGMDVYGNNHRYGISNSLVDQVRVLSYADDVQAMIASFIQSGIVQSRDFTQADYNRIRRVFGIMRHPLVAPFVRDLGNGLPVRSN